MNKKGGFKAALKHPILMPTLSIQILLIVKEADIHTTIIYKC